MLSGRSRSLEILPPESSPTELATSQCPTLLTSIFLVVHIFYDSCLPHLTGHSAWLTAAAALSFCCGAAGSQNAGGSSSGNAPSLSPVPGPDPLWPPRPLSAQLQWGPGRLPFAVAGLGLACASIKRVGRDCRQRTGTRVELKQGYEPHLSLDHLPSTSNPEIPVPRGIRRCFRDSGQQASESSGCPGTACPFASIVHGGMHHAHRRCAVLQSRKLDSIEIPHPPPGQLLQQQTWYEEGTCPSLVGAKKTPHSWMAGRARRTKPFARLGHAALS